MSYKIPSLGQVFEWKTFLWTPQTQLAEYVSCAFFYTV